MKKLFFTFVASLGVITASYAQKTIFVSPQTGDATLAIRDAINEAKLFNGKPVTIKFAPATYLLTRQNSAAHRYFGSNTTTESENPNVDKHISIWLKEIDNVTIDGDGARFLTDGEVTSFVIDGCENVILKNFSIDSKNPTVTEMKVVAVDDTSITTMVHPKSKYEIREGKLFWIGNGWEFGGGIAQIYDPISNITWRDFSPLNEVQKVIELEPNLLRFNFGKKVSVKVGQTLQMRDGIRDELGGLVVNSKNIKFENVDFFYIGNFSLLAQFTENVYLENVNFEPEQGSGRTNSCFADSFHLSGCKGIVSVVNCRFSGAHDDAINVHGTHLLIKEFVSANKIRVRFMHGQTYGLDAFFKGDEIEFINRATLMPMTQNSVKEIERISDREVILTLNRPVSKELLESKTESIVVENATWTTELHVRNTYFSRIPTRCILVSTRKKVVIEDNVFDGMQMSAVLIANDAMSWYESGYVRDVSIRRNKFINCGEPVIFIAPENHENGGCVHKNIKIEDNTFILKGTSVVDAKSCDGLTVKNNLFIKNFDKECEVKDFVKVNSCENVVIDNNRVE